MQKLFQRHFSLLIIIALAAVTLFSSCSKVPEEARYIPKDAGFIMSINAKKIEKKVNWDSVKNSGLYKNILQQTADSTMRMVLTDPQQTGIDISSHFYLFFKQDKRFGSGYGGAVVSLKDAQQFENFLHKADPAASVKKENDISWVSYQKQFIIGWNKNIAILLGASDKSDHQYDDNDTTNNNSSNANIPDEMKALFHLSKSASAASLSPFTNLQKKDDDITFWINMEQVYKNISLADNPMMAMLVKPEWYDDYYITASTDFEDGKIVTDISAHVNDKVAAIGKNLFDKSINTSMIKNIPSDSLAGVLAMAFKPEGLKDVLTMMGMDGLANAALSEQGLTTDDILKAFKGDMIIAVSNLTGNQNTMNPPGTINMPMTKMNWLFAMTIGDTASMNKLLDLGVKNELLQKNGNSYSLSDNAHTTAGFIKNDKMLTVASTMSFAQKYLQGNTTTATKEIADIMKGKYFGLYINFDAIAASFSHQNQDSSQSYSTVVKRLAKDMYLTADQFKDNTMHASLVFRYKNDKQNSLQQLLNASERIYEVHKSKKDKWMQQASSNGADSVKNSQ